MVDVAVVVGPIRVVVLVAVDVIVVGTVTVWVVVNVTVVWGEVVVVVDIVVVDVVVVDVVVVDVVVDVDVGLVVVDVVDAVVVGLVVVDVVDAVVVTLGFQLKVVAPDEGAAKTLGAQVAVTVYVPLTQFEPPAVRLSLKAGEATLTGTSSVKTRVPLGLVTVIPTLVPDREPLVGEMFPVMEMPSEPE